MRRRGKKVRHDLGWVFVRLLLGGARFLPLAGLRLIGRGLVRATSVAVPRERRRLEAHLAAAFPERDAAWRQQTASAITTHFGRLLGEVAWLWSVAPERLLARTEWSGRERLERAFATGKGVIVVTGHCGNWEWMNLAFGAAGMPLTVAAREVYDPRINAAILRLRAMFGGDTALRGRAAGQKLVATLRRGGGIGLLIDQDIDAPGVFVDFFGRPAWTPVGAAALALKTGAWLVPTFAARQPDGRMRVVVEEPFAPEVAGATAEDLPGLLTARLTAAIEGAIRREVAQWVWMHQRWKRQPGPGDRVWRWPPTDLSPPS